MNDTGVLLFGLGCCCAGIGYLIKESWSVYSRIYIHNITMRPRKIQADLD